MKTKKPGEEFTSLPTLESILDKVLDRLKDYRQLGVILIDMTTHFNLGSYGNKSIYQSVTIAIQNCIVALQGKEIRKEDIIAVNLSRGSKYYIFLSRAREKKFVQIDDYERLCLRVLDALTDTLFSAIYPITQKEPQIKVGYAFTFYNPFVEEMSFIQNLMDEAETTAEYLRVKIEMMKRKLLYQIIVDEEIVTRYQPIIDLTNKQVFAYEAFIQGKENTFFSNAYSLFDFARSMGLEFELDWVSKKIIIKNARGMARDKKLFIKIIPSDLYKHELYAEHFKQVLLDNQIKPGTVVFEFTPEPLQEGVSFISKLKSIYREITCAIVLKDIGDEENLNFFADSAIAYIKIGMDIVRHIGENPLAGEFVKRIKKIAQNNNCELIAEGIHAQSEMEKLAELGVRYGQGYFFAKPETVFADMVRIEDFLTDKEMERNLLSYIYFKRGKNYFQKGDYDKAILEFSKVIEVDKQNIEALYYRAYAFSEEGAIIVALKDLKAIMGIDPYYPDAQFLKGFIYEKKGDLPTALQAYGDYIENCQGSLNSQVELASQRIGEIKKKLGGY
jgi:EAL domain-containing protein (putative c-di-GMP-specific phosphodiesterase class I)